MAVGGGGEMEGRNGDGDGGMKMWKRRESREGGQTQRDGMGWMKGEGKDWVQATGLKPRPVRGVYSFSR
jgi:hypothetical protein